MTTTRDIITLAMKEAGVLGLGQTLLAEDANDGLKLLNRMLAQWQKRRWLVPSLYEIVALGNGNVSNLIGPGKYYNALRPDKIQAAYFKQVVSGQPSANQVSYPLSPIWSYEDYSMISLKALPAWPSRFFYDAAYPYGNVYIWPVPDNTYEIHLICKSPIGFNIELLSGVITSGGSGYTNGTYNNVPLVALTGYGGGATANITVSGGAVSSVALNATSTGGTGSGYKINDTLTALVSIGSGAGFVYTTTGVTDDLNAVFNMPDEYEEAIHYNLCIRLCSMYQYPATKEQVGLAKVALNTIKIANAQIPTLSMPRAYRFNRNGGSSFYIYNADMY